MLEELRKSANIIYFKSPKSDSLSESWIGFRKKSIEKNPNAFEDDFVSMQRDWNKTTKQQFQILSCLVADVVTTGFHTDAENKDNWLWSQ